jgi:HSP20 family molecular chaperone IbpA
MSLPRLWTRSQELASDPFRAMRREMENAFRAFDQNLSSPDIGAGAPAISVAETKDAFEVTAELPGVDEKDIKVSLDENQLVISGEKKAESTRAEKDWHVEERSYGSFYRSMSLPLSRKKEPLRLILTRACCISPSRSPPRRRRSPRQSRSSRVLHRVPMLPRTNPLHRTRPLSGE